MHLRRRNFIIRLGVGLTVVGSLVVAISAFMTGTAGRSTNVAVAPSFSPPAEILPGADVVLAVGDIAVCGEANDELTGRLVESLPGTILTLGDQAYESGAEDEFEECFDPSWGSVKKRIRPVLGNHDDATAAGGPYYEYFGDAAGTAGLGWYSFEVGDWHIIALNSNCAADRCDAGSPQGEWLEADLAQHRNKCTLAFWHQPRWSSGEHGSDPAVGDLWKMLYDAGVEAVLSGHDHDYERFAAMDSNGSADPERGIRQFVVGTGGRSLDPFGPVQPNSEARSNVSYGVLRLALQGDRYDWEFIPSTAGGYTDAGSGACH